MDQPSKDADSPGPEAAAQEEAEGFSWHDNTGPHDWEVQSIEDIILEAERAVLDRKPWMRDFDDAALERRRQHDRQDRSDRAGYLQLPDNRVPAMEDQLSSRIRAQLLDGEEEELFTPPPALSEEGARKRPLKAAVNPWYFHPKKWFDPEAQKDPNEPVNEGFPYDNEILRTKGSHVEQESNHMTEGRNLAIRDKETMQIVEEYRMHMKGSRLPHFLL